MGCVRTQSHSPHSREGASASGLDPKKGVSRAPASRTQRVRTLRAAFLADERPSLETGKLVFIDETAAWCHMPAFYGWSKAGQQAVMTGTRYGKRLSMVGAIAVDGPRGHMLYEGTMDGDRMVEFVMTKLGPNLHSGDILVMDGASVHKTAKVKEAVESFGAKILILPPYSPELNPIEHAWSTVKAFIRKVGAESMDELRTLANEAWERITPFLAGWIGHCGYALST